MGSKWKIQLNESQSVHVDFSLRKHRYEPILIDGESIPKREMSRTWACTLTKS